MTDVPTVRIGCSCITAGIFSGNIAVIHSVLGELTDETNQAIAFPIYGLFWPLGAIIGPLLGGTFSNPAERFPNVFDYQFLKEYPYFLPCFVAGCLSILGALLVYLFLGEVRAYTRRVLGHPIDHHPADTAGQMQARQLRPIAAGGV